MGPSVTTDLWCERSWHSEHATRVTVSYEAVIRMDRAKRERATSLSGLLHLSNTTAKDVTYAIIRATAHRTTGNSRYSFHKNTQTVH